MLSEDLSDISSNMTNESGETTLQRKINNISKNKMKHLGVEFTNTGFNDISDSDICTDTNTITENSEECENIYESNIEKNMAEMKIDIYRILRILQQLTNDIKKQKNRIQCLENEILKTNANFTSDGSSCTRSLETDEQKENSGSTFVSCASTANGSATSMANIIELNEYDIKLDKIKSEINIEFIEFKKKMTEDYAMFKNSLIQTSRIRSVFPK